MARQSNNDNLGYFGTDFQFDLVKCFIEDCEYFKSIEPIIDQNYFTEDTLRIIVGFMKDRYNLNESVATYKDLTYMVRGKISDAVNSERVLDTLEKLKKQELNAIDIVEGYSEKFFKQQNLVKAMNQANEIIKKGDYDRYDTIEELFKKALEVNNLNDLGYRIFDGMEEALKENYRLTIPTGADELDKVLNGGIAKGELGVIIAPSGIGKTSATTGFAAMAATTLCEANNYQGYKVVHVHFEDEPVNIKRKYYAYLSGYDASELSLPQIRPLVVDIINNNRYKEFIQNNIVCFHPYSGEWSPTDIERKLKQLIASGFKPDMLVVDYFECLKLERGNSIEDKEYTREGITMRKLEAMANKYNIAIWCPVQGTRDSFNQQIVGLSQGGGSVKKTQIAHIVISFARTDDMKPKDLLNLFINKFRAGKITKTSFWNVTFNNGTCKFDFSTMLDDGLEETMESTQRYNTDMARQVKASLRKN